jgi:predicted nucleic acid-binding protein
MTALVDTNVLFAAACRDDAFHEEASALIGRIDRGKTDAVHVTEYVVAETMSLVGERVDHETAVSLLDSLQTSSGIEIESLTAADYRNTEAIFRRESALSFFDASIVAYADRAGIDTVWSFDTDFDTIEGIGRQEPALE